MLLIWPFPIVKATFFHSRNHKLIWLNSFNYFGRVLSVVLLYNNVYYYFYYIMTQNGPVTAPGSQGVFRGKGVGSKWGQATYFSELVLSCPVAGVSTQYLFVGGCGKQIRSER
jgi:hypothetical protein